LRSHFVCIRFGVVISFAQGGEQMSPTAFRFKGLSFLLAASLLATISPLARAQTFNAFVSGIASDPTGAFAPNVKITVTDKARGTQ
jgi:hypothetical protein